LPTPAFAPHRTGTPEARVHEALERHGYRVYGVGRYADCPVCRKRRKLGVRERDDGSVAVRCFYGCQTASVLAALDLKWADLYEAPTLPTVVPGDPNVDRRLAELRRSEPTAYAVYKDIEAHALGGPQAHPSQQRIADRLGLWRETVNRACAHLRDAGVLSWQQKKARGAPFRHNVYELLCTWTGPLHRALRKLSTPREARETGRRIHLSVIRSDGGSLVCDFSAVKPWTARAGPP
jgi:Crp-like helix-turn-helix domain